MLDDPTRTAGLARIGASEPAAANATRDLNAPTGPTLAGVDGDRAPPAPPGYELLEVVGSGGMGVVYRAREVAFDRDVAVKILLDVYPVDSPTARRFLDEARITAQLQHPAIPPVHHVGTLPDCRPFLAMKLIKGDTLADLLAAEPKDRSRFIPIFGQVCQAVAYAHARRVIHRDLKPSNVMVGAFAEVQVMDWGLAKEIGPDASSDPNRTAKYRAVHPTRMDALDPEATQPGAILGTPAFMSPEQASGEVGKVDERSDVFGLGAVLCAILTGRPPYWGTDTESLRLMAIRGDTAEALARLDSSGADLELVALAKRCLSVNRDERPRDAGEVATAVTEHLAAAEERARRAELDRIRAEELRERQRVQVKLSRALTGLFFVVAIGATCAVLFHDLWQRALRQRAAAEAARGEAESAREAEKNARGASEQALGVTKDALGKLAQSQEKLERVEYGRAMQVSLQEWREHNVVAALTLLDRTRPELRGWEWRYLHRLCHADLITLRHANAVASVSYSPDGTRIVTASWDKTARIWDARSGVLVLTLSGHTDFVHAASFNADGSRIVTASQDGTARVWDARTGAELLALNGKTADLRSAAFSPDGTRIVTAGVMDGTARVWDAQNGAPLLTLKGKEPNNSHVRANLAAFSPDGTRILTATHLDKTASLWDSQSGELLLTLRGHAGPVNSAGFSADGTRIVTGSADRTARIWDAKTGAGLVVLKRRDVGSLYVNWASFNPDGSRVVTADGDGTARLWDAQTGAELRVLVGHTSATISASFSPDGSRLVTSSYDGTARVWDVTGEVEVATHQRPAGTVAVTAFSADGTRIVTGYFGGTATVWDTAGRSAPLALKGHAQAVFAAAISAEGSRIVTGGGDNTAKVWDAKTGALLLTLTGHDAAVRAVAFSPDGARIITQSYNEPGRVWNARTGEQLLTLEGRTGVFHAPAFSPDGSRIVTDSEIPTARLWDARTGAVLATLTGHSAGVLAASFSPDGSRVLTASLDRTARVWDAKTGAELLVLRGHTASLRAASFSSDGSRIVTAGDDRTVKVWDAATGAELLTLKGHTVGVATARWSADGSRLLTASQDGIVKVWDARPVNRDFLPREPAPPPRAVK